MFLKSELIEEIIMLIFFFLVYNSLFFFTNLFLHFHVSFFLPHKRYSNWQVTYETDEKLIIQRPFCLVHRLWTTCEHPVLSNMAGISSWNDSWIQIPVPCHYTTRFVCDIDSLQLLWLVLVKTVWWKKFTLYSASYEYLLTITQCFGVRSD